MGGICIYDSIEMENMIKNELTLSIDGMHCDACVRRVTAALGAADGVVVGQVKVGSAHVSFDPAEITPEEIAETVDRIGFRAAIRQ